MSFPDFPLPSPPVLPEGPPENVLPEGVVDVSDNIWDDIASREKYPYTIKLGVSEADKREWSTLKLIQHAEGHNYFDARPGKKIPVKLYFPSNFPASTATTVYRLRAKLFGINSSREVIPVERTDDLKCVRCKQVHSPLSLGEGLPSGDWQWLTESFDSLTLKKGVGYAAL
jgi:hypothetical protein